jgi:transcriptional regulator with XRE-family HTH domain
VTASIDFDILREMMRSRRDRNGMTFADVAKATGVPRGTVANFLLGLTDEPKAAALEKYLAWLEMPAERFIGADTKGATLERVEAALASDPTLTPEGASKLSEMLKAAYVAVTHQPV